MSDWFGGIGSWLGNNANWLVPTATMAGSAIYGAAQNNASAQTQANALQQAAGQQQQSNADSLNFLRYAYDQSRADQAPWRGAGQNALGALAGAVGDQYQTSPGYQFQMDEGMRAVQNSAAARGMLGSGATMKALTQYGQGVANQDYGQWMNRLAALSGVGQTAAGNSAQAAQQFGQNAAGVTQNTGNALAALTGQQGAVMANGANAGASALMSGANGLLGYWAQNPGMFGGGGANYQAKMNGTFAPQYGGLY